MARKFLGAPASLLSNWMTFGDHTPVRVAKSAAYTVVATDLGKLIVCSGVFTLSLTAAATLGAGFFFYVDCTNTTGAVTITPASGTIEGQTSIQLYGSESKYMVFTDGTNWYTLGRQKGWVQTDIGSVTTVSSLVIASVCADPEARDIEFDCENQTQSASASINLTWTQGVSTAGVPAGLAQSYSSTALTASSLTTSPVNLASVGTSSSFANGSFLFKNIKATTAKGIRCRFDYFVTGTSRIGQFYSTAAGALINFTIAPGSGTMSIDTYSVRIFRQ